MISAIRTQSLSKRFRRTVALRDLDLDVPPGSIYGLLGPNGAGKTTTIKVLMNILGPSSGRSEVLGTDSRRLSPADFTRIGYVSENQEMPEWMTVGYFLDYLSGFYPAWDASLAAELARTFQLPLDRPLRRLSRGMRMKAALVTSLAYHPKLIVLDEPFGGLDPLVRDELIEGLLERAPETTIFVSSHDLAEIENVASHVGYLEEGQLRFSEDMTALAARFREVELTFDAPPALPSKCPQSWMQVAASGAVVQFIESQFEEERTRGEISKLLGQPRGTTFTPMSLRAIFLAMAKAGRGRSA